MPRPLRVLLIEDSLQDAELNLHELTRAGYQPDWQRIVSCSDFAATPLDGIELILADYTLPDGTAIDTLQNLISRGLDIPFIIVSGTIGEEGAVELLKLGATDYLLKDRLERLGPAVNTALAVQQLRQEKKTADETLRQALQQTLKSRDWLESIIESISDPMLVVDRSRKVLFMNRACQEKMPLEMENKNQLHCHEARGFGQFPCSLHSECPLGDILREGKPINIRRAWTSPEGKAQTLEITASPLRGPDGLVEGMVEMIRDITGRLQLEAELKQQQGEVAFLSHYDPLTDLPNRAFAKERLVQALARAERKQCQVALLYLDLDRFKTFNESLGHDSGDQLLIQVAHRLRVSLRAGDTLARLGGDEFLIVLDEITNLQQVTATAQHLLGLFAEKFELGGNEYYLTASIGIALGPDDGENAEDLLKGADAALYRAKGEGRNTYQFYTTALNARSRELLLLESSLRRALDENQLELHYQPQLNLTTGAVVGMEALIRWRHPQLGLIPPGDFIPLAEESGLILPIGTWVIEEACRQIRAWQQAGLPAIRVAVNISARQLRQTNFLAIVQNALSRNELPQSALELEITESLLMENIQLAGKLLKDIEDQGISMAIDDFGTGYSSLAYLKSFPISKLKIDRSFVRDIPDDKGDVAIVSAIIGLAENLGMRAIAEGIETTEQLEFLRNRGCEEGQGFLLSRPLPAAAAEAWLRKAAAGELPLLNKGG